MGEQLKELSFKDKKFEANGKTYFIEQLISYDRWLLWRKLQMSLMFGKDGAGVFAEFKKIYDALNHKDSKVADAIIIAYNAMDSIKGFDDRIPQVCQLCALFINTADEDRSSITDAQIQQKVDDWKAEGISMNSFFLLAIYLIPNFQTIYEKIIQNISPESPKEESTS